MPYSELRGPSGAYKSRTISLQQRSSSSSCPLLGSRSCSTSPNGFIGAVTAKKAFSLNSSKTDCAYVHNAYSRYAQNSVVDDAGTANDAQTIKPMSATSKRAVRRSDGRLKASKSCWAWQRVARTVAIGTAVLGFAGSLVFNVVCSYFDLFLNVSESLPYGLYKVTYLNHKDAGAFRFSAVSYGPNAEDANSNSYSTLERGQVVLMCLPDSMAKLAYTRDYIASGKCKGGVAPVGKHVIAMAGDKVKYSDAGVEVNGYLVPLSSPYAADGVGRELPYLRTANATAVAGGEIVLVNSFAGSFDSRYFGAVPITQVIGTLEPVLVFS